ncbi:MAG: PDZ domain-containing protein, partial [Acidimicrobiales bacterium]
MLLVIVYALGRWQTNEYAITPGDATPVAPLIKIQGVKTNPHHDKIMLTDVYLSTLNVFQWIRAHFESHVQFIAADELVEPGVSTNELEAQGFLEMSDAKYAAEVAAFRALGWSVPATRTGTVITGVVSPSPANTAKLKVGDEIVGVGSKNIYSGCQLVSDLHNDAPGTTLTLWVNRVKISNVGVLSYGAITSLKVTTAAVPSGLGLTGCPGVSGADRSWLGVSLEDGFSYHLPASVN